MTRRELFLGAAAAAGLRAQVSPVEELINPPEFAAVAQKRLDSFTYALIAPGDRKMLDRITFRPRLMIDTTKFDLSTEFLGEKLFTPIIVGPVSGLKRFHPNGEAEMAKGAAGGKALLVTPTARDGVSESGKISWITVGTSTQWDWKQIDEFRATAKGPVVVKGIMTPEDARACVQHGINGIVVSSYTGTNNNGLASPIEVLPKIAEAVNGKLPILIDGGFQRGSDVLKAVALGARAVLIARPAVWGLASYGAAGVQAVIELMQSELGRDMAMCGKAKITEVDASVVKVHLR